MDSDVKTLSDFGEILKRRKWSFILPMAAIFMTAVIVAMVLPRIYKSTSTILIEEQEIPRDYVMATVTSYAEQRLQTINQRTMSTTRLLDIISRFNLYADLREKWTTEEIVGKMREDISLETISADVIDRRTGRPAVATIAFSLSYEGKNPGVVQQVANVLASLYLEENLKVREQQTLGASRFLENELEEVQTSLAKLDTRISEFKQQHNNTLPELYQVNLQGFDRIEREIDQLNDQLRTFREREGYLQTQLAAIPTDDENRDKVRLKELQVQVVHLKSRFSEEYPDVIKTRAEIVELERRLGASGVDAAEGRQENPAYITLASQLASTRSEIDSVKRQIDILNHKNDEYRRRIEATPGVEEGYKALLSERKNLQTKYDDLMNKCMEARVARGLEKEQMGERFTLIDAARLPEKPISPNAPAICLIGLVLGIGTGVGSAFLREHSDPSVKSAEALARATGFPVLASIPEIVTRKDIARRKLKRTILVAGITLSLVAVLLVFHFLVMDLDVFWAKLMRKINRMAI
jgi:polysaccharide chain length determinant protein (PEP-CTERM system associated)